VIAVLVGRINRWKGQNVLLDAALRIDARQHPLLRFVIVGDVADGQHHFREQMLARIRQQGLQERVRWLPFTPDVDRVWAGSDIAVVPSTEPEPFGRVAIEAMAHGLPVVAAAHGGLVEIVADRETGALVPPGDAAALAAALERLAASPALRRRWGEAGLRRQQQHFSQRAHDAALLGIVGEMVHGGAPPSALSPGGVPRDASAR
jgi:glycosyltransferase involved in cell wall biosynthesis